MIMRINIIRIILPLIATFPFAGCNDWVTPEAEMFDSSLTEIAKDDSYYEALRAYKSSDHSISFGWYSEWGEGSVSTVDMLQAVPDSMDIISLWNNATNLTETKKADLKYVQQVKGTKVLMCTFLQWVGKGFTPPEFDGTQEKRENFWGWKDGDEEAIRNSLDKYAKAIADTINLYGYDGLDIDYEPNIDGVRGKLDENATYFGWAVEAIGKYLGPKSGTGKLFIIDGEIYNLPAHLCVYFDYFVSQAYSVSGGTPAPGAGTTANNKESRLSSIVRAYADYMSEEEITNKFVITENLESAMDCLAGGFYWTDSRGRWDKSVMPSLVGFADWKPANGFRKGGFGGYRFSNEKANNPAYKWMRRAIQQQNPAPGKRIITDDDFKPAK